MGANVSADCCSKGDTAAGADAENPTAADPDAKASEADSGVYEVAETAPHRLKVMKSLGHLEVRFQTKPSCRVRFFGLAFEGGGRLMGDICEKFIRQTGLL